MQLVAPTCYLAKIRRQGVAKHADMKQRLDQLAENDTAIVTLIKVYQPHAKTPAFTTGADKSATSLCLARRMEFGDGALLWRAATMP